MNKIRRFFDNVELNLLQEIAAIWDFNSAYKYICSGSIENSGSLDPFQRVDPLYAVRSHIRRQLGFKQFQLRDTSSN